MPLTRKRATIWTCSDGKDFTDFKLAAGHERDLQLENLIYQIFPSSEYDPREIFEKLLEHHEEIWKAMNRPFTSFRKEALPANVEVAADDYTARIK